MGVAGFVSFLLRNPLFRRIFLKSVPGDIDALYIEINALIYQEKAKHFDRVGMTPEEYHQAEQATFEGVFVDIQRLVNLTKPKLVFLSVDGVAPMAKIMQQRQRRYLGTTETKTSDFDSTQISPGTDFMRRFDTFLYQKLEESELASTVIYSSHLEEGEGEHKIAQHIRESTDQRIIIHGLDADLFMINLPIVQKYQKEIILLRENTGDRGPSVNMANLKLFNDVLHTLFKTSQSSEDFTMIMFLIGNDFLPRFTIFERTDEALETLIAGYKQYLDQGGKPLVTGVANWNNLSAYLTYMSSMGYFDILLNKWAVNADHKVKHTHPLASGHMVNGKLDVNKFKSVYYDYIMKPKALFVLDFKADPEDIANMSLKYMQGLDWAYSYYMNGGATRGYKYYYPYFYPPLIEDLIETLNQKSSQASRYDKSLTFPNPLEQLLMIIPIQSKQVVPRIIHLLYDYRKSPIYDLFPSRFLVDQEGKTKEYEKIALIPFPDYNRVRDTVKLLKIDDFEMSRYATVPKKQWDFQSVQPVVRPQVVKPVGVLPTLSGSRVELPTLTGVRTNVHPVRTNVPPVRTNVPAVRTTTPSTLNVAAPEFKPKSSATLAITISDFPHIPLPRQPQGFQPRPSVSRQPQGFQPRPSVSRQPQGFQPRQPQGFQPRPGQGFQGRPPVPKSPREEMVETGFRPKYNNVAPPATILTDVEVVDDDIELPDLQELE